jgi:electron transport complex protein RnfG
MAKKTGLVADMPVLKGGITLAAIAAICTALVAITFELTDDRIDSNAQAWLEQSLLPVLAGVSFDSGIGENRLTVSAPHELPGNDDAMIYRVYSDDSPAAALFVVSARDGYSGPIRLLVGVDAGEFVTGLSVLEHRETPGLGDGIESRNWQEQFVGRSLGNPAGSGWNIRDDGGEFDALTGASVTPRAVVKAVRETLEYYAANRDMIFATANNPEKLTE